MKTLMTLVGLMLSVLTTLASTTTATSSGDWDESSNWDNGDPGCFDTIVIPAGIQIDITSTVDLEGCFPGLDSIIVLVSGDLVFQNGKKLKLPCDSDVYVGFGGSIGVGSGGGNSTYIEICSSQYWNANGGNLTGPTELCDGGCNTLPIELVSFIAVRNELKRRVDLSWVTLSESENDYFTIERSSDGKNWTEVSQHDGAGNSSAELTYEAHDLSVLSDLCYYRLKQTDFNGAFAYSSVISLQQKRKDELIIYPNPISSFENLVVLFPKHTSGQQSISIRDVSGKEVLNVVRNATTSKQAIIHFPNGLSSGTYFVIFEDSNLKLVIL